MSEETSNRKKDHLELCLTDKVKFKEKTTGFEKYDFMHYAITEIDIKAIDFSTKFFNKWINYPFIISSMTGGAEKAEQINYQLASAANELNIPIGVGSQRQLLENDKYLRSYKIIRQQAKNIPVLGNLGMAEIVNAKVDDIKKLIDVIEADAFLVHLNPAQELLQPEGNVAFKGFLKNCKKIINEIDIPFIAKEVGAGISEEAAERLLEIGFQGIDVAGAGGTSWSGVEILRNNNLNSDFWDWGLPTSYCIKKIKMLKYGYNFVLIGSGGINNAFDMAKAFALGADYTASARTLLKAVHNGGEKEVVDLIKGWFETLKKIMLLTNSNSIQELSSKIVKKEELY
ncbi:MAG TPA: type 2 isopentenyl-diphosphate Delta-isomerase [Ignavibacteriaceae bacterium]|nr:type 2 isopentenyl-diphosphate Delta-isomerase [Ignavibacteriaceae bacterium]